MLRFYLYRRRLRRRRLERRILKVEPKTSPPLEKTREGCVTIRL